jgi:type II secretory pathway pseudopilin PulG
MLVVMIVLGVCMALGAGLIVTSLKAGKVAEATDNRVSRRQELSRQFRDDVARASASPQKHGELAAGPALLILQKPGDSSVVYRWENKKLERIERIGEKETRRLVPVGPEGTEVEFVRPSEGTGLVTLRTTEPSGSGPAKRSELSAALGGNLR